MVFCSVHKLSNDNLLYNVTNTLKMQEFYPPIALLKKCKLKCE